jgi:hypothetical protein
MHSVNRAHRLSAVMGIAIMALLLCTTLSVQSGVGVLPRPQKIRVISPLP